jgi:hypothetical protein
MRRAQLSLDQHCSSVASPENSRTVYGFAHYLGSTMPFANKEDLKPKPELSAILLMVDGFQAIRRTVHHLSVQSARERLELIIVTTRPNARLVDTNALKPLGAWQVVEVDKIPTPESGWVAGIRKARASVVVICEDHSFPDPGWAKALIEAHRQDCAAVAPAMDNGNPNTTVSWANFLLICAHWFSPNGSGPVSFGPGHNTSYKRPVLLEYYDNLESWLTAERVLHFDLLAKGHRILLAAEAVTHHVNISLPRSYLSHSFHGGRLFGGSRAANWSRARAALYACAFPLIPFIRLRRLFQLLDTPAKRRKARFWASLPWICAGLLCHAVGEAVGYLTGSGNAMKRYMSYEIRRIDHVIPSEKALWLKNDKTSAELEEALVH